MYFEDYVADVEPRCPLESLLSERQLVSLGICSKLSCITSGIYLPAPEAKSEMEASGL